MMQKMELSLSLILFLLLFTDSIRSYAFHQKYRSSFSLLSLTSLKEFEENYLMRNGFSVVMTTIMLTIPQRNAVAAEITSTSSLVVASDEIIGKIDPQSNLGSLVVASDEIIVKIDPQSNLGLGLIEMKDSDRIIVSSIKDNAPNEIINNIKPGFILTSVEDKVIEGTSFTKESIARAIRNTKKDSISLTFRDPNKFFILLNSTIPSSLSVKDISTRVSINNENSLLKVQRLRLPSRTNNTELSAARYGDVVDILYQARKIDGSIIEGLSERIDDISDILDKKELNERQFFVLGSFASLNKQNTLLSSPGLSVAMKGMLPGERRLISCPVILLQKKALSDINYDEEVVFDITLVSLNGQRK